MERHTSGVDCTLLREMTHHFTLSSIESNYNCCESNYKLTV